MWDPWGGSVPVVCTPGLGSDPSARNAPKLDHWPVPDLLTRNLWRFPCAAITSDSPVRPFSHSFDTHLLTSCVLGTVSGSGDEKKSNSWSRRPWYF